MTFGFLPRVIPNIGMYRGDCAWIGTAKRNLHNRTANRAVDKSASYIGRSRKRWSPLNAVPQAANDSYSGVAVGLLQNPLRQSYQLIEGDERAWTSISSS